VVLSICGNTEFQYVSRDEPLNVESWGVEDDEPRREPCHSNRVPDKSPL